LLDAEIRRYQQRGLLGRLIHRLSDQDWNEIPLNTRGILVSTILDHADDYYFKQEASDIFTELLWLVDSIIKSLPVPSRIAVAIDSIRKSHSLFIPAGYIGLEDQRQNRNIQSNGGEVSDPSDPMKAPVFTQEELDALEREGAALIAQASMDGRLASSTRFIFLLSRWKEWGHGHAVEDFVRRFTATDEGFLQFLQRYEDVTNPRRLFGGRVGFFRDALSEVMSISTVVARFADMEDRMMQLSPEEQALLGQLKPAVEELRH
jgi:hypothetical protein